VRAVHWNTHHGGVGSDNVLDPARLGRVLATLNADVISLNEVEQHISGRGNTDQVGTYLDALGAGWTAHLVGINGKVMARTETGQCNVLLSKHPMTMLGQLGCVNARSVAYAVIQGRSVYSTHVDNESAGLRNTQLTQQLCWHKQQSDPRILMGDFNCQSGSTELGPWRHWYRDAWEDARAIGKATSVSTNGATRTTRIDYIFHRGLKVLACDVPDTRVDGVWPSDHHPVVVDFA
jgi:endonuclease/exonuclease/phosphatase family metal-dependent hydrolase